MNPYADGADGETNPCLLPDVLCRKPGQRCSKAWFCVAQYSRATRLVKPCMQEPWILQQLRSWSLEAVC